MLTTWSARDGNHLITHTLLSVRVCNTGWVDVRLTAHLESGLHQWEHQVGGNEGHLGEGRACSHSQGVVLHHHTIAQLSQHYMQINCSLAIKTQMQADQTL